MHFDIASKALHQPVRRRHAQAKAEHWVLSHSILGPGQSPQVMLRSEEHTSELQSLMRISYAVFCLKKKNQQKSETSKHKNKKTKKTVQKYDYQIISKDIVT